MDAIQSKLAERDSRRDPRDLLALAADRVPLLLPTLGLATGIWIQGQVQLSPWIWLVPCIAAVAASLAWFYLAKDNLSALVVTAGLGCLCLGAVRLADAQRIASNDVRQLLIHGPRPATIRGYLVRDIRVDDQDWTFKDLRPGEPSTRLYVKASQVQTAQGWRSVQGILRVWVGEPLSDLQVGDEVQLCAWLQNLQPPTNPGQFDIAAYLMDQGVVAAATLKSRLGIERMPPSPARGPARLVASVRQKTCQALACHWPDDPRSLALAQALVLGYRGDIDGALYEAFYRTGLLHYVSLSGMHFAILVGIVWFAARMAGLLRPAAAVVCSAAVGVFLLVIPTMAPALRAAIICWVFCAGVLLRRQGHGLNTLALAAMILLLARPTLLFDPSWQLSFACMAGIFTLSRRIEEAAYRGWELYGWRLQQGRLTSAFGGPYNSLAWLERMARATLTLLCVGLGAWLGSAGIVLYHFYNLTPLAAVWTILVFPAVWVVMVLGVTKVLVSLLAPLLCPGLALCLAGATQVLIWAVEHLGRLDVFTFRIGQISPVPILLYYVLLVTLVLIRWRRPAIRAAVVLVLGGAVLTWIGWNQWQHTHTRDLVLTCLDVGHGQAAVARLPRSTALLLDAGSMAKADVGSRVVNPFLDYSGLSRLDAAVLSHTDVDHINGLPEVVRHSRVHGVYADAEQTRPGLSAAADLLRGFLEKQGQALSPLDDPAGPWNRGGEVVVLWPPADPPHMQPAASTNDRSAVVAIRFAGRQILLCSDIEQDTQGQLLQLYPELKADVLVVPHHGSIKTLLPGFIDRLDPQILICSCSASQYEEHQVVEPLGSQAAFYTGRDGAVTVRVDPRGRLRGEGFLRGEKEVSGFRF
jgi:competence protein ComEC